MSERKVVLHTGTIFEADHDGKRYGWIVEEPTLSRTGYVCRKLGTNERVMSDLLSNVRILR